MNDNACWGRRSAVSFDAGNTLLEPVRSVADIYVEKGFESGARFDEADFRERLRNLWPKLNRDFRSRFADLRSSEAIERAAWFEFTRSLAEPFPSLAQRHSSWLKSLEEYFDRPDAWKPVEHAVEVVAELSRRGKQVSIVTNWHSVVRGILTHHRIAEHCNAVLISAEAGRKKPHPAIFERALKAMGVPARDAIHVGDSWEEDVEGALGVGMGAVLFRRGNEPQPPRNGVPVLSSLRELLMWK